MSGDLTMERRAMPDEALILVGACLELGHQIRRILNPEKPNGRANDPQSSPTARPSLEIHADGLR